MKEEDKKSAKLLTEAERRMKAKSSERAIRGLMRFHVLLKLSALVKWLVRVFVSPLAYSVQLRRDMAILNQIVALAADNGKVTAAPLPRFWSYISRGRGNIVFKVFNTISFILYRPYYNTNRAPYDAVDFAKAERMLLLKYYLTAVGFLVASVFCLFRLVEQLWRLGFSPIVKDYRDFNAGYLDLGGLFGAFPKLVYMNTSGGSAATTALLYSLVLIGSAKLLIKIIELRKWKSTEFYIKEKILRAKLLSPDQIAANFTAVEMGPSIFITTPYLTSQRMAQAPSAWPSHEYPGVIFNSTGGSYSFMAFKKPVRDPIVFGGANRATPIDGLFGEYKSKIIAPMKKQVLANGESEQLFLGEVLDADWWESNRIYADLAICPHIFMVGQTRSGKTKSVISYIHSFHSAYPDTIWYFADGKEGADFDTLAQHLSPLPVAKKAAGSRDHLIEFANIIDKVWGEYVGRIEKFNKASLQGNPCSTIMEYRRLEGPLPRIWMVIDEFGIFNSDLDFDTNYKSSGTLAYRIATLARGGASFGINLLFASQRYQNTDFPTVLRSNLTAMFVHNVGKHDFKVIGVPSTNLGPGEYILEAAGVFSHHTGQKQIKCKFPYIGDQPDEFIKSSLKPCPPELKTKMNYQLVYQKGSDDLEKANLHDFCIHIKNFLSDQNYAIDELSQDFESTDLQMIAQKGFKNVVTNDDGTIKDEIKAFEDSRRLGVCAIKDKDLDVRAIKKMQAGATVDGKPLEALIIFVQGRVVGTKLYDALDALNEKETKIIIYPLRDLRRDNKSLELSIKKSGGKTGSQDFIETQLIPLGISGRRNQKIDPNVSGFSDKTPTRRKLEYMLTKLSLSKGLNKSTAMGVPFIATRVAGQTPVIFLVPPEGNKDQRDISFEKGVGLLKEGAKVVIVTNPAQPSAAKSSFIELGGLAWRLPKIQDEWLNPVKNATPEMLNAIAFDFVEKLGLVSENGEFEIFKDAALIVRAKGIDEKEETIATVELECAFTRQLLRRYPALAFTDYQVHLLDLDRRVKFIVFEGAAPIGAERVDDKRTEAGKSIELSGRWDIVDATLIARRQGASEKDELLMQIRSMSEDISSE